MNRESRTSFLQEFQKFALRGNVIDLAVAVVIGTAFNKIVSSLVDNIIMPFVGVMTGGIDLSTLSVSVGEATVAYGAFLQSVIDFVLIAFSIFVAIKVMNALQKKQDEAPDDKKPVEPAEDIKLLREIRDSLKNSTKTSV